MKQPNHKLVIFLGDIDTHLSTVAKKHDQSAWLLDHSNYKKILVAQSELSTTVYTSLGDLPKDLNIVYNILSQAETVYYCPPAVWSDNKKFDISNPGESIQGLTELILNLLPDNICVHNLICPISDPDPLVDTRKTELSQLWIAGCSVSHGYGISANERYGQLVADELDMPCSFLTRPGAAINWAADQILRSDIRKNDIVIFGLTHPERSTHYHNNQLLKGVTPGIYNFFPEYASIVDPVSLFSHQTMYTHLYSIKKVINFCKKIDAKLFLVGLLIGGGGLLSFYKLQKNYIHIPYSMQFKNLTIATSFIDVGTDNRHPGPRQHQQYKEIILNHIQQRQLNDSV